MKPKCRPALAFHAQQAGAAALVFLAGVVASANAARADLKMCNTTSSRIGVAIGYQDEHGAWATEGWWNIAAQSCETLLKGGLPGRYIYVHAVDYDRGGEWTGPRIMCTAEKMFLLRDGADCGQRGQRKSGFYEVDVGTAKDWTIRLSQSDEARQR